MTDAQPKRLIIKDAIEAGGATKESLMELAEVSSASLATNFTYLRLMGFYPVKGEDGTYHFVSEEEWDTIQETRAAAASTRKAPGKAKTHEEILNAAQARFTKCEKALATATEKHAQFDSEVTRLRLQIADAELRLAELALEAASQTAEIETEDEEVEPGTETQAPETDDELV